jgi:hypothetical protein
MALRAAVPRARLRVWRVLSAPNTGFGKLKPNVMNPLRGCLCTEKWNFRVHAQEDRFVEDKKTWRRSINSPVRRCLTFLLTSRRCFIKTPYQMMRD